MQQTKNKDNIFPVNTFTLVTPYPKSQSTNKKINLKDISNKKPLVLHLFTT